MPILNIIGELKPKNPNQKYFFEVWIRFHEGGDRMEFQHHQFSMSYLIIFPSSTLSETDR